MEAMLDKVRLLRKEIDAKGYATRIQIDGGINEELVNWLWKRAVMFWLPEAMFLKGYSRKS